MDMREARRQAWRAAYLILESGGLPVSERSQEGFAESESSVANFSRWERAWEEVLRQVALKGGVELSKEGNTESSRPKKSVPGEDERGRTWMGLPRGDGFI